MTVSVESRTSSSRVDRAGSTRGGLEPGLILLALGMAGLGVLGLFTGDFAMEWQPVAAWFPGRTALAYAAAAIELCGGAALLVPRTRRLAIRVLFAWSVAWALLKVPALVMEPRIEAVWLGLGELTVIVAGAWVLLARLTGMRESWPAGGGTIHMAHILFGASLVPIGLSHFIYTQATLALVPAWLPARSLWGAITGLGQMASGLGILLNVLPRAAAWAEAAQIALYTLLVWLPALFAAEDRRLHWTAFLISWTIGAAACAVAQHLTATRKLSSKSAS